MKITRYIPDTITSMNLVCGLIGVVFAFKGRCDIAFPMMLAAAVFDFCDGLAARALGAYSDMGKELDSLCDMVSFGVLPSVMLYKMSSTLMFGESWVCWSAFLIAVFSGLRLAKFNVDERQHYGFLGLPTPACAILVASMCYYAAFNQTNFVAIWMSGKVFVPLVSVCMSALLICEIPMFSMKLSRDASKALRFKRWSFVVEVILIVAACIVFKLNWSLAALLSFTLYIVKNIAYLIFGIKD